MPVLAEPVCCCGEVADWVELSMNTFKRQAPPHVTVLSPGHLLLHSATGRTVVAGFMTLSQKHLGCQHSFFHTVKCENRYPPRIPDMQCRLTEGGRGDLLGTV